MAAKLDVINSKNSKEGEYFSLPKSGLNLSWAGKTICLTLDSSGLSFGIDDENPSLLKRLKLLPRWSYEFDYAGRRLTIKYAPLLEVLTNLKYKGYGIKQILELSDQQLKEILLPSTQIEEMEGHPKDDALESLEDQKKSS